MKKMDYDTTKELLSKIYLQDINLIIKDINDYVKTGIDEAVCVFLDMENLTLRHKFGSEFINDYYNMYFYLDDETKSEILMTYNGRTIEYDWDLHDEHIKNWIYRLISDSVYSFVSSYRFENSKDGKIEEIEKDSKFYPFLKNLFSIISDSEFLKASEKFELLEALGFECEIIGTSQDSYIKSHDVFDIYNLKGRRYLRGSFLIYGHYQERVGNYTYYKGYIVPIKTK